MTVSLSKVRSCNALLRMLLVCIDSYLKLVLRCEYLVLVTPQQDAVYLREDAWLFVEAKMRAREKKIGKLCSKLQKAQTTYL